MNASRKCQEISEQDARRIVAALERWSATEDIVALRTRAFAYVLWDGALRTKAALQLNVEDVVRRGSVHVLQQGRTRDAAGEPDRTFSLSDRTRRALSEYLKQCRELGWSDLTQGPLFLSSRGQTPRRRMSQRTGVHAWRSFVAERVPGLSPPQLDDLVFTGRLALLRASGGDAALLALHAGISVDWACQYVTHLHPDGSRGLRRVLSRLHAK